MNEIMNGLSGITSLFSNIQSFDKATLMEQVTKPSFIVGLIVNILILTSFYIGFKALLKEYARNVQMRKLQGKIKTQRKGDNPLLRINQLNKLHKTIEHTMKQKDKEEKIDLIFYMTIGSIVAVSILFFSFKQYLLALIVPIFLLHYAVRILISLEVSDLEYMYIQLPKAIDTVLKAATRYGDIKNIFFESSKTLPQPIRGEFETMARRMNSRETEEVLLELKDKYDDIWINSFVFILISMKDDAERQVALDNLANLREMLEKENNLRLATVTERKISVNTNYALSGIAAVIGIGAVLMSESARTFYFSTPLGIACFVGGYALTLATIQVNIKLSSTKEK